MSASRISTPAVRGRTSCPPRSASTVPNATVAQDLEPEYITTDGDIAWVTLQENNAIAVINIRNGRVKKIFALGFKDHSKGKNRLDASDDDDVINIARWPVFGMYQPDALAVFRNGGKRYLITVNEGDARDYDGFAEEERVADLTLDPTTFPDAADLQDDAKLGRLTVTTALGDIDQDGDFDQLYVPGGRSFSIWNATTGALVFDSGAELEQLLRNLLPKDFNANHEENDSFDNRSDNKGPEPEGVTLGKVKGKLYAFVGLERIGGVLVLDLSDPANPEFVDYVNNRRFRDAAGEPIPTCAAFDPPDSDDIEDCVKPNSAREGHRSRGPQVRAGQRIADRQAATDRRQRGQRHDDRLRIPVIAGAAAVFPRNGRRRGGPSCFRHPAAVDDESRPGASRVDRRALQQHGGRAANHYDDYRRRTIPR